jgi:general secretion pathway protein D
MKRLAIAAALVLAACTTGSDLNRQGLELVEAGQFEEGIARLEAATALEPHSHRYRADLLRSRERSSDRILRSAEQLRIVGKPDEARQLYERALVINPSEPRARAGLAALDTEQRLGAVVAQAQAAYKRGDTDGAVEQLRLVLMENPGQRDAQALQRLIEESRVKAGLAGPVLRSRLTKPVSVQFRDANLRLVFDGLSRSTGINFIFDREVRGDLKTTIFARDVSVEDAVDLILLPNQLEKKVLSENTVLVYPNTPAKQREYQDLVMKTFYLENADVKTTLNLVRTMLKTKDVFIDEKLNLLVMRDTPEVVRIAERLIAAHDRAEPEVVLELEVLEVDRTRLTELGVKWPDQVTFGVLDLSGGALTAEDLKNYLGRSATTTVSPSPSVTLTARKNEGVANLLSNPRIRVRNREKARVLVGDRLPVISAVITPSAVTPITTETVSYLDVGLKLDIEPQVHLDGQVAIRINLEVSTASNRRTTANGTTVYDIGTRNANTVLRLADGETQVLMGLIRDDDRRSADKVPGLGDLPILGRLFSSNVDDRQKSEIILSVTPRVVRNVRRADAQVAEFWSGTEAAFRTQPIALRATTSDVPSIQVPPSPTSAAPKPAVSTQAPAPAANGATPAQVAAVAPAAAATAAAKAPNVQFNWIGPAQARVGEPVTLSLNARTAEPMASASLQIAYDPLKLAVMEVKEGSLLNQGDARTVFNHKIDPARGRILVSINRGGAQGAIGDAPIVEVTFKAVTEADAIPVQLTVASPVGTGGRPLEAGAGTKHELKVEP